MVTKDNNQQQKGQNVSSILYMRKNTSLMYKKECPLKNIPDCEIDYKNIEFLKKFTSERGKIIPSRVTAVSNKKQRKLALAIKRARLLAFLPFASNE